MLVENQKSAPGKAYLHSFDKSHFEFLETGLYILELH